MEMISAQLLTILYVFAPAFTSPTFAHACELLIGTILTPGRRTVASALRAIGRQHGEHFTTYHRVLNLACWSPLFLSRLLLQLLLTTLYPTDAPVLLLIDSTLERRGGPKIALKGWFPDAVRSSTGHTVVTKGIQWLSVMLLVKLPWCARPWAMPFLTVPTRSPAISVQLQRRHRTLPEYACLLVRLLRWWMPDRTLVVIGDGGFAVAALGNLCRRHGIRLVSKLLLNAQLYDPVPPQPKGKPGVKPAKGPRQPKLADMVAAADTDWQTQDIPWYTGQNKTMQIVSGTSL